VFVTEFVIRLSIAPDKPRFLRRHWWQILFLVLPFLAMLRVFFALRIARAGRLVSAAVRGTRSAAANLRGRMLILGAVTLMTILLGANVLFEFGGTSPYASALYAAALTTITGQPMAAQTGVVQVMNILLGLYSVVIFAALAGSLGAYFLEKRAEPGGGNVGLGEQGIVR
jgi:voltage-gated potassium channel